MRADAEGGEDWIAEGDLVPEKSGAGEPEVELDSELEEKIIQLEKAQSNSDTRLSERDNLINDLKQSKLELEEKTIELEKAQSNSDDQRSSLKLSG